jgi:hypothetical protein
MREAGEDVIILFGRSPFSAQLCHEAMNRPILVTGHHRAGTTWIGRMLAASREAGYIHEPFNPGGRPGICSVRPSRYFTYVPDSDPDRWRKALQATLSFRYDIRAELKAIQSLKDIGRMVRDYGRFTWLRYRERRAVMKDPIALFSAEWLAKQFGAAVIVLIRHPAAFVSSLLRLGWTFPFEDLLDQPKLIETYLSPFEAEIRHHVRTDTDLINQAVSLWKMFQHVISTYRDQHPSWKIVRMEDLAIEPIPKIGELYRYADLSYTDRVQRTVRRHTHSANPSEVKTDNAKETQRDSQRAIYQWTQRLSREQIEAVRSGLAGVSPEFYSHDDWDDWINDVPDGMAPATPFESPAS